MQENQSGEKCILDHMLVIFLDIYLFFKFQINRDTLVPGFHELDKEGYGTWVASNKNMSGFIKSYPLTDTQLDSMGINRSSYEKSFQQQTLTGMSPATRAHLMASGGEKVMETYTKSKRIGIHITT